MGSVRIALANLAPPRGDASDVVAVEAAIAEAGRRGAAVVAFPEAFLPGYRPGRSVPPHDPDRLRDGWHRVDRAAAAAGVGVILGTERRVDGALRLTARVTDAAGRCLGFQDKTQLDPSEEGAYAPGSGRRVFDVGPLRFGVVICHEGWRYPETVRHAARAGAWIVFHPHFEVVEGDRPAPTGFADPANTFHEKAALCRAAENTVWFATINCALAGSATTSAVVDPDGRLAAHHPYEEAGLLVVDVDPARATGLLAHRLAPGRLGPPSDPA